MDDSQGAQLEIKHLDQASYVSYLCRIFSCIIIKSSYGFTYSTCKYVIQSFLSQTLILSPHKLVSLLGFSIVIYSNLCLPWDENVIKIIQNCCLFMAFLPRSLSDKLLQTCTLIIAGQQILRQISDQLWILLCCWYSHWNIVSFACLKYSFISFLLLLMLINSTEVQSIITNHFLQFCIVLLPWWC